MPIKQKTSVSAYLTEIFPISSVEWTPHLSNSFLYDLAKIKEFKDNGPFEYPVLPPPGL